MHKYSAVLCCLLFALTAPLTVCPQEASEPSSSPLPWLHANEESIRDEAGAMVLLRGVNHMGLLEWNNAADWVKSGTARRHIEHIARLGFNVIRLPINWSSLEPEKGKYDESRLLLLDELLKICGENGVYVVPEMHQYYWSHRFGGDGVPDWVCSKFPATHWKKDLAPVVSAWADFWHDEELQQHFIDTWLLVARRYANCPTIAGYDLFNEPNPGLLAIDLEYFEAKILTPFYRKLIDAIRKVDERHLLFVEPMPFQGTNLPGGGMLRFESNLRRLNRKNVVYAPHLYTGGAWYGEASKVDVSRESLEHDIEAILRKARQLKTPAWIGEYGVSSSAKGAREWALAAAELLDKNMMSSTWWSYWPDDNYGLLNPDGTEKSQALDIICRPYPRRVKGRLSSFEFSGAARTFTLELELADKSDLEVEVMLPSRHFPQAVVVSIFDISSEGKKVFEETFAQPVAVAAIPGVGSLSWKHDAKSFGLCGVRLGSLIKVRLVFTANP